MKYICIGMIDIEEMTYGEYFGDTKNDSITGIKPNEKGFKITYSNGSTDWSFCPHNDPFKFPISSPNAELISQIDVENFIDKISDKRISEFGALSVGILKNGMHVSRVSACERDSNFSVDIAFKKNEEFIKYKVSELLGFLLSCAKNGFECTSKISHVDLKNLNAESKAIELDHENNV